ncbi:MAG: serine/threonine protein kinase [Caldilineaceae bacterium]|nr:serine/threonine protein kinase [Caldilineaceae bacterium]
MHILEPGTVLRKRYEILELVGQGGMGAVYKTNDLRLEGRVCAVKEIMPLLTVETATEEQLDQLAEQFRTEASVLARLDHPNLPKVSDYFSLGRKEYLVMDFVGGRDLQEMLQEARRKGEFLPEEQVLAWADQLLDAISYLQEQDPPVMHRDIKPSNIKMTPRGSIKLVDFGLVKILQPDETRTVTVVQGRGTVAYTPLEQYGGDTGFTDLRSDIYSLCATLYHLLGGEPPVDAKQRFLQPGCLTGLRELNPAVSPRAERAIFQGMAMHPNERPANAEEMRELLLGSAMPLNRILLQQQSLGLVQAVDVQAWNKIFRQNRVLVGVVFGLLALATLISIAP